MTKKIQYRDNPSSVEWKDIIAEDVGAAAEDVSKSVIIDTKTPPADPENNKIYIQDNGINHDIYVKSVYNRTVDGPYTISSLNDLASFDFEPIYEPYQDDYRQISHLQGELTYPNIQFTHPTWSTPTVSDCYIIFDYFDGLQYLTITVKFPAYNLSYSYTIFISSLLSSNHEIKWLDNRPLYIANLNATLQITKNTPIFTVSYVDYYANLSSDPDQWNYRIHIDNDNCYFITYNTDNKYDLLDYKDFGLKDVTGSNLTVTQAFSNTTNGLNITSANYCEWGQIGQLNISFKPTVTFAANALAGTTITSNYRPKSLVAGGNRNWAAYLNAGGTIGLRNISGAAVTPNSVTETIGFTYIINND